MKRTKQFPLSKEKLLEAENLPAAELRMLVANYYQAQRMRKTMDLQKRHLSPDAESVRDENVSVEIKAILKMVPEGFAELENNMATAFDKILTSPVARWIKAQRGLGPVIAAGLLAHINIEKAPTAGHIWSFAGLNPERKWISTESANALVNSVLEEQNIKKPTEETVALACTRLIRKFESVLQQMTDEDGEVKMTKGALAKVLAKRPYNAQLKQVCWHAGQCFMKQSNDPDCFYGHIYRSRKAYEIERNEAGHNAARAREFTVSDDATKAVKDKLKQGKLPDFNIDSRARRYAVKIFLSHLHAVMFFDRYGTSAPLPYSIAMLGHAHFIDIPHAEMFPGLREALRAGPRKAA